MGVGAVGIGLTRGFFSQCTTKNVFCSKKTDQECFLTQGMLLGKPRQHILYVYGQLSRPGFFEGNKFLSL